jgi:predicted DNA-binding transcriptional regulator AlpA
MDKLAYSLKEFCVLHSISRTALYNLIKDNNAPAIISIGRHKIISVESAKAWREKMSGKSEK